ncbi:hypothetical protein [Caproiciproducens faecalis]|uniref:Lipoprotein n=1 Tax=Caproiciproducens faecalis TaxID=2820301 RepID=A0ABS7DPB9_9FIRM|nr:hypothetical protein [Caproiciproducens faecalis]MBW7573038.1 hypothetical protein [Caproiciproducens faecalis]
MKISKLATFFLAAALLLSLAACGKKADADVLMREAKTNANAIQNCTATINNTLEFSANNKPFTYQTDSTSVYWAKPFALKSTQTSLLGGVTGSSVSYTVSDSDGVWFYSNAGSGWQKTTAEGIASTPLEQIDILRLFGNVTAQKYVRETTLDSVKVHKIELTFQSEVLRSTIENIVTATGMSKGSQTVVQTLLDSAPAIYGYCYVDEAASQIVRVELDATEAVNQIFQNIDGSGTTVTVSKCEISGNITGIGKAPAVELPADASAAQTVQAAG